MFQVLVYSDDYQTERNIRVDLENKLSILRLQVDDLTSRNNPHRNSTPSSQSADSRAGSNIEVDEGSGRRNMAPTERHSASGDNRQQVNSVYLGCIELVQ